MVGIAIGWSFDVGLHYAVALLAMAFVLLLWGMHFSSPRSLFAVSAMAVSCGPKAKGKNWGKQKAKIENKACKMTKTMTEAEGKEFFKGYKEGYQSIRKPNK